MQNIDTLALGRAEWLPLVVCLCLSVCYLFLHPSIYLSDRLFSVQVSLFHYDFKGRQNSLLCSYEVALKKLLTQTDMYILYLTKTVTYDIHQIKGIVHSVSCCFPPVGMFYITPIAMVMNDTFTCQTLTDKVISYTLIGVTRLSRINKSIRLIAISAFFPFLG